MNIKQERKPRRDGINKKWAPRLTVYETFADVPDLAKVSTLAEIGVNVGNLSIPMYVKRAAAAHVTNSNEDVVSLQRSWAQWQTNETFWQQMDVLLETLDSIVDTKE